MTWRPRKRSTFGAKLDFANRQILDAAEAWAREPVSADWNSTPGEIAPFTSVRDRYQLVRDQLGSRQSPTVDRIDDVIRNATLRISPSSTHTSDGSPESTSAAENTR